PPGWEFDLTESNRDGPTLTVDGGEVRAVDFVGAWVDAGAPNGDFSFEDASGSSHTANFEANVLPLFTEADVWFSGSQACTDCHFAASEDSYHEMDLSTYEGILVGADVLSKPPGEEIIEPGDWHASGLRARLRNNRMPPGWEFDLTESNRDGPTLVVGHPADQAPATLPVSGSDNSVSTLLLWGLIATGVIILLAGIAIRRRERAGF
ncbi:MAG: hypothetical protein ACE5G8_14275, partial [Anaerolineae bacterium]